MKKYQAICVLSIFIVTAFSYGQIQLSQSGIAPTLPSAQAASYYYIAKPGDVTIQVNLWGQVQKPGRFEVQSGIDVVQLISLAGGPLQYADLTEVKLLRRNEYNPQEAAKQEIINLKKLLEEGSEIPILQPGDTIIIEGTAWLTIRDIFSGVTTVAAVASAVSQVIYWTTR